LQGGTLMIRFCSRCLAALAMIAAYGFASHVQAQITGVSNSDVEGYFGATSDAFQQAEGPTIPPWGASGPGFYPITGHPFVPALYPGFPNPSLTIPSNISFAAPFAHGPSTPFTDGQTTASYTIEGGFFGPGTSTSDAYVRLGVPGTTAFTINQPATATGYAYEQVNFAMIYNTAGGALAGGLPGPRPYLVSGSFATGGYAQFGAQVNYWWLATIPGTTLPPTITFLGSLDYNFTMTNTSGPFSTLVNYTSSGLLGATGPGFLMITGDAFVTGDPFELTVVSVPEPSSWALAGGGLMGLVAYVWRRRKRT
jgi:hypothetical protein